MATRPLTIVSLLKNVPLDADYNHTLYFASRGAQTAYFGSLQRKNFNPQTYQRVGTNQIRVSAPMDDLYEYNYLMFNNGNNVTLLEGESRYENKWFYAFISNVEYVNDNCALITYEIDVMQTFMFDYTLCDCFVEREHSETDGIGEHIEPEPVECGEYVYNNYRILNDCSDLYIIIQYTETTQQTGNFIMFEYDGVISGYWLAGFHVDPDTHQILGIADFVHNVLHDRWDSVINMYMCPAGWINQDVFYQDTTSPQWKHGVMMPTNVAGYLYKTSRSLEISALQVSTAETLDGYEPKNNKMYTYPYNYYCVDNSQGKTLNLRYEFFDNLRPTFTLDTNVTAPVSGILRPRNYKNLGQRVNTEILELSSFPLAGSSQDAYQAYLIQNKADIIIQGAGALLSTIGGVAGGSIGAFSSGVSQSANLLSKMYKASIAPNIGVGSASNGNANIAQDINGFYGGRVSVTSNQAKIIDDFFTMYGYACNLVKEPNISSRPHWNYVKTVGCQINSSIPNIFANKIRGIYDNGITFWKSASEIGDYSLDNSPV